MIGPPPAEAPDVQRAYQVQLAHLDACAPCRGEAHCEEGLRIRRALQAARTTAAALHNSRRENGGL